MIKSLLNRKSLKIRPIEDLRDSLIFRIFWKIPYPYVVVERIRFGQEFLEEVRCFGIVVGRFRG